MPRKKTESPLQKAMKSIFIFFVSLMVTILMTNTSSAQLCAAHDMSGYVFYPNGTPANGVTVKLINKTVNASNILSGITGPPDYYDGQWYININTSAQCYNVGTVMSVNATTNPDTPTDTWYNESTCTASASPPTACPNMTLQIAPKIQIIREQSNTSGLNSTMTVRLMVYNNGNATLTATDLSLVETFNSSWNVTDCGNCAGNNSTSITWNTTQGLPNITADNYRIVSYTIYSNNTMWNYTFSANVTYNYTYNASVAIYNKTVNGTPWYATTNDSRAMFEFGLDLDTGASGINREIYNGTNYKARWSIKNIGNANASDMPDVTVARFTYNYSSGSAWNISILDYTKCDNCTVKTFNGTHNMIECNITMLNISETANVTFNINTSLTNYDEVARSNATYTGNESIEDIFMRVRALVGEFISITLSASTIDFGNLNPGAVESQSTSGGFPLNVTVDAITNVNINLSLNGTNFTYAANSFLVDNMTYDNNSDHAGYTNTTLAYPNPPPYPDWINIDEALNPQNRSIYFWINTPSTKEAGIYNSTVSIKAYQSGTLA